MLDNLLMALGSLLSNKMRALLTMLGIIIGIGSVIAIDTVGGSLSGSISDSMSGFGASDINISLTQKDDDNNDRNMRFFMRSNPSGKDLITDEMLAEFRSTFPEKIAYIKLSQFAGTAELDSTNNLSVTGVNEEALIADEVELLYGRAIDNAKDSGKKLAYVADSFVTDCLGLAPQAALGTKLSLTLNGVPHNFYIIGVYAHVEEDSAQATQTGDTSTSSSTSTTTCYIPLETAKELADADDGYRSLTVVTSNGTDTIAFLSTVENYFASWYTHNDSWTVSASSMESMISTMTEMLDTVALAISAIAAISLLVGGIGVMNIMLVSVTERTREIGTRKALGATPNSIRLQFVVEAIVICLIGGIIGVLTGIGLGTVACDIMGYSTKPDPVTVLLVMGISMGIGIFFGYYPANKAAKLNPIDALRYE